MWYSLVSSVSTHRRLPRFDSTDKVLILRHGSDRVATTVPESLETTLSFAIQQFPNLQLPIFLTRNVPEAGGDVKITEGVWRTSFINQPGSMLILDVHESRIDDTSPKMNSEQTGSQASGSVSNGTCGGAQKISECSEIEVEVGPFRVDGKSKTHRFRVPLDANIRDVRRRIAEIYSIGPGPLMGDNSFRLVFDGQMLRPDDSVRELWDYGDEEAFVKLEVEMLLLGGMTKEDYAIFRATGETPKYRDKISQLLNPLQTDPYLP